MNQLQQTPEAGPEGSTQMHRVLGLPNLVLFGMVYMVPLTIFSTYGIVTEITGGRLPVAYAITLLAMLFTARSYGLMSKAFPVGGSAYVYTQRSFGANVGFMAGWALLLDYLFLPMINYLLLGIYLNEFFPAVPPWAFMLAGMLLVTILNVIGIVSVARTNIVIIGFQFLFIILFIGFSIAYLRGQGNVDLMAPLRGTGELSGFAPLAAGAAILCLSFLGFDSITTFAEEARNPKRDLPRAILLTTLICGLLFIALAYVSHLVYPSHQFENADSASIQVVFTAGGQFLSIFFTAGFICGAMGSALVSQASVSRILFSMGRDGVLPKRVFGYLHPRFKTPTYAIIIVSIISLTSLFASLEMVSAMISFGALVAFSAVNLAVIKYFFLAHRQRGAAAAFNYLVLPLIGLVLTIWLWTSLSALSLVIGIIWIVIGLAYLAYVTGGFRRSAPMLDLAE
ncbi:APC family permease [Glutamicibacter sp. TV12E]|uniref:APC family permease n=1 Tax=Glutamicibacter sp. TV12E TaxID=3446362 RepID=UPI0040344E11